MVKSWILIGAFFSLVGCSESDLKTSLDHSSQAADRAASSINRMWVNVNREAEKLDTTSANDRLEENKKKLTEQLSQIQSKAGDEYRLLQAQYNRIDAAERLKQAQAEISRLKESGKQIESTVNQASSQLTKAQQTYDLAKVKYEDIKSKMSKAFSGPGPSLP